MFFQLWYAGKPDSPCVRLASPPFSRLRHPHDFTCPSFQLYRFTTLTPPQSHLHRTRLTPGRCCCASDMKVRRPCFSPGATSDLFDMITSISDVRLFFTGGDRHVLSSHKEKVRLHAVEVWKIHERAIHTRALDLIDG